VATSIDLPLRRRVARLSLATVLLIGLALLLVCLVAWLASGASSGSREGRLPIGISYSRPRAAVFLAVLVSVAAAFVGLAALHTAASMRVLARDRRIPQPLSVRAKRTRALVLGPLAVAGLGLDRELEAPPGLLPERPAGPGVLVRSTVLIPAHNEALTIGATLSSLRAQHRQPDRVIVIADNCTDDTAGIARGQGAEVVATVGNTEKKAGALNQVLADLLPTTDERDVVMVMDADSTLSTDFLQVGLGRLEADPDLMAVGGLFYGEDDGGLIGQLQRNEYTRYQRHVMRRRGKVYVLTGTGTIFRALAFRAVADARGVLIPGPPGRVYDTLALTEDNEMTLALKTLGAKLTSPPECRVTTEVMPSLRALWRQRMRWGRGALENLGAYGLTRATLLYWGQQLGLGYGVIALNTYLLLILVTALAADGIDVYWFWVVVGLVFVLERLVTVWRVGWRGRLLAAPIVIELCYVVVLQATFVASLVQIATGRRAGWNYVPRESA
jgi:poly-beta-1,6-N-acetyl-D-glucosamine synthase